MTSEEAIKIGTDLVFVELEWEESDRPHSSMPCPNGKTWGELSDEERAGYELAMWWARMHEWVAWQTKH